MMIHMTVLIFDREKEIVENSEVYLRRTTDMINQCRVSGLLQKKTTRARQLN